MTVPVDGGTAAALGLVQGLTEFLPVSSSGHVAIGAMLFGVDDFSLAMVVALHAGTLLATAAIFRDDIRQLCADGVGLFKTPRATLASDGGRTLVGIIAACAATAAIGLTLEPYVENWSRSPVPIAIGLLLTAVALLSTRRHRGEAETLTLWGYLLVGVAQGIAVAPGISRSGATIAVAMLLGMSAPRAFRFSFLLSLPTICGAVILKLSSPGALSAIGVPGLIGGAVALVTGIVSLILLRRIISQGRLWAFSIYLIPLGLALLGWGFSSTEWTTR